MTRLLRLLRGIGLRQHVRRRNTPPPSSPAWGSAIFSCRGLQCAVWTDRASVRPAAYRGVCCALKKRKKHSEITQRWWGNDKYPHLRFSVTKKTSRMLLFCPRNGRERRVSLLLLPAAVLLCSVPVSAALPGRWTTTTHGTAPHLTNTRHCVGSCRKYLGLYLCLSRSGDFNLTGILARFEDFFIWLDFCLRRQFCCRWSSLLLGYSRGSSGRFGQVKPVQGKDCLKKNFR